MTFLPRYEDWPDHLTPLYARAAGGNGGGGASSQVSESIDLSAVADPHVVISSIDGTPLEDFSFIFGYFRAATTTPAATDIRAELSVDGITFRTSYRSGNWDKTSDNAEVAAFMSVTNEGGTMYASFIMANIRGAAPTALRSRELSATTKTAFVGHSSTSVEDTQIRFFTGAATSNWNGGTLELFGVTAADAPTIQTHDFGVTSGANHDFTLPAGHIVASIYVDDLTTSVSTTIGCVVGTGDSFLDTGSNYRVSSFNSLAASAGSVSSFVLTKAATTGHAGWGDFWGFGSNVPIAGIFANLDVSAANPDLLAGATLPTSPLAYDQIRVFASSGTITAGVVTVVSWAGAIDVEEVDFGVSAAATHDFTDLSGFPIVVMTAPSLTTVANAAAFLRASTDGVSFDAVATDYRFMYAHDAFDDGGQASQFFTAASTGTTLQAFYSMLGGFGTSAYLVQEQHEFGVSPPLVGGGVRDVAQINTALQLGNLAASNFNAGKVYRMGISF